MDDLEWGGERLEGAAVAVSVIIDDRDPDPIPTIASASVGRRPCIIRPERLGQFLVVHRDAVLVGFEAGLLHRTLDRFLRRSGDLSGLEALWEYSCTFRFHD